MEGKQQNYERYRKYKQYKNVFFADICGCELGLSAALHKMAGGGMDAGDDYGCAIFCHQCDFICFFVEKVWQYSAAA